MKLDAAAGPIVSGLDRAHDLHLWDLNCCRFDDTSWVGGAETTGSRAPSLYRAVRVAL